MKIPARRILNWRILCPVPGRIFRTHAPQTAICEKSTWQRGKSVCHRYLCMPVYGHLFARMQKCKLRRGCRYSRGLRRQKWQASEKCQIWIQSSAMTNLTVVINQLEQERK